MTIQRVRILWGNWPGAPGYTNLYTSISLSNVAPIVTFFDSIKQYLPTALTVQVPQSGDLVAEATGVIQGVWTGSGGATVTGTAVGVYAGPVGAVVEWLTGGIVAGRRVQGKSYIVPLSSIAYQSNGTLLDSAATAINTAAATLQTALGNNLVVWSRPFEPDPDRVPPDERDPRAGTAWPVLATRVPDMVAVMRSRRT